MLVSKARASRQRAEPSMTLYRLPAGVAQMKGVSSCLKGQDLEVDVLQTKQKVSHRYGNQLYEVSAFTSQ